MSCSTCPSMKHFHIVCSICTSTVHYHITRSICTSTFHSFIACSIYTTTMHSLMVCSICTTTMHTAFALSTLLFSYWMQHMQQHTYVTASICHSTHLYCWNQCIIQLYTYSYWWGTRALVLVAFLSRTHWLSSSETG